MTGIAVAHRESTTPDGVLVQEAAAGSGVSYGALYDRYATQIFNYCLRLTGSPEDAADATQEAFTGVLRRLHDDDRPVLDFSSYLFAAARNESYALMRRRARVSPSDAPPEDRDRPVDVETEPERALLLRDSQEAVRAANARLAPRHREVLALRELGGRSYDEIGQVMGISENGAAQLIWRARAKLREAMTAGAVASVVATSEECERAQVLLTRLQDGEPVDGFDREWLDDHLDECGSCRSARGMLLEVGASYRSWLPVAALVGLKSETLTAAGHVVGADWSEVAGGGTVAGGSGAGAFATVATLAVLGVGVSAIVHDDAQLDQRLRDQMQPPAVSAPAPESARAAAASVRGGDPMLSAVARSTVAGGIAGRTEPRGDAPIGGPRAEPRGEPRKAPPADEPAPRERPLRDRPSPVTPKPDRPSDTGATPEPAAPERPVTPPPDPAVTEPPPPPPPPPPEPSGCTFPGGGNGHGPAGCPPGHGGVPPGKGGTPPGQAAP